MTHPSQLKTSICFYTSEGYENLGSGAEMTSPGVPFSTPWLLSPGEASPGLPQTPPGPLMIGQEKGLYQTNRVVEMGPRIPVPNPQPHVPESG